MEKWLLRNRKKEFDMLRKSIDENPLVVRLLANRGIFTREAASLFLYGGIENLHDGRKLKDLEKGLEIVKDAIDKKSKITIYGDYDCDGVCSTAILYKGFKRLNANFNYHIPNRESEGYGMNKDRIRKLKEEGTEVIVTCDNGISAFEEVELAIELGMKVVLTDHHDIPFVENEQGEKEYKIPQATALINPKRKDCEYPFKNLCGAGVSYKLMSELYKEYKIDKVYENELIELAGIATVCDVVDLLDENRIIVKKALEIINNTENLGIKELIKIKELDKKEICEYHFGFVIGPCINATGRLEIADISLELLITEDVDRAKELSKRLYDLNEKRQELTIESIEKIEGRLEKELKKEEKVILVYEESIHESIAGIVAGRIREKYNLPTIIMTKGSEMPKGSGRSIEEYNMFEELTKCKEYIYKFGGHPMAAGLSVEENNLEKLKNALNEKCTLTDDDVIPKIYIDAPLDVGNLDFEVIETLNKMRPFGKANSAPVLGAKNILVTRVIFMGKERKFLRFTMKTSGGKTISGVNFTKYDQFKKYFEEKYGEEEFLKLEDVGYCNFPMDILYYPEINEFNGRESIQVSIKGFRL